MQVWIARAVHKEKATGIVSTLPQRQPTPQRSAAPRELKVRRSAKPVVNGTCLNICTTLPRNTNESSPTTLQLLWLLGFKSLLNVYQKAEGVRLTGTAGQGQVTGTGNC